MKSHAMRRMPPGRERLFCPTMRMRSTTICTHEVAMAEMCADDVRQNVLGDVLERGGRAAGEWCTCHRTGRGIGYIERQDDDGGNQDLRAGRIMGMWLRPSPL